MIKGELCISPMSFFTQIPGKEFIQAIHESVIYEMDFATMQQTCQDYPDFRILLYTIILNNYLYTEGILNIIHTMTPRQRYEWVIQHYSNAGEAFCEYFQSYLALTRDMIATLRQQDRRRKLK